MAQIAALRLRTRATIRVAFFAFVVDSIKSLFTVRNALEAGAIAKRLRKMSARVARNGRIRLSAAIALRMAIAD